MSDFNLDEVVLKLVAFVVGIGIGWFGAAYLL